MLGHIVILLSGREANFKTRFDEMKQLVVEVGRLLPHANIPKVLSELCDWEDKGTVISFLLVAESAEKCGFWFPA